MKIKDKSELEGLLRSDVYMANEEVPIFSHYASLAKDVLVEIGAGLGASAVLMLINAPGGASIHSIDSFVGDTIRKFDVSEKLCRENVSRALNSLGMVEALKRWYLCPQSSHQLASSWSWLIDFLYIDGDHRYEAVKQDFDDWFKYLKVEGLLLLHDSRRLPSTVEDRYVRGWPGPTKLAQELKDRDDLSLIDEVCSLTIWKKSE